MADPITIGAGVGAGVSLMRGGSPIKGALLGAAGGATYGGATGTGFMGSLLGNTAPAVLPAGAAPLTNAAGEIVGPSLLRSSILNPATGAMVSTNAGAIPLSVADKIGNYGATALESMKSNPLSTLSGVKTVNDVINPVKPAEPAVVIPPILKGTAPKILPNAETATGQTGLETKLAMLNSKRRNLYDIPIDYSIG